MVVVVTVLVRHPVYARSMAMVIVVVSTMVMVRVMVMVSVMVISVEFAVAADQVPARSDFGALPLPQSQQSVVPKSIYLTPKTDRWRPSKGDRSDRIPRTTPRQSLSIQPALPRNAAPSDVSPLIPTQATNPVPRTSPPTSDQNKKIGIAMRQGQLMLTRFHTMRLEMPHRKCRKFPEFMITGFGLPKRTIHTMADNMLIVQKRLCAGNGSVVVTCYQNEATISLRQAKPGDGCRG